MMDFKKLDIYRKIPRDLTHPTKSGAAISVICILFILFLLCKEFLDFITVDITNTLYIDNMESEEKIPVFLNLSTTNAPCKVLGLDIVDDKGRHEVGHVENTIKTDLLRTNGCLLQMKFKINKVPGNFHISTHGAKVQPDSVDMRHIIHDLKFGSEFYIDQQPNLNPLKDTKKGDGIYNEMYASHEYTLKLIPTTYQKSSSLILRSYHYTYAYKHAISIGAGGVTLPAIWFSYDLSPLTIAYREKEKPIYHFLTTMCAIIGGTFTVAGIIDSLIFSAGEWLRKIRLNKLA